MARVTLPVHESDWVVPSLIHPRRRFNRSCAPAVDSAASTFPGVMKETGQAAGAMGFKDNRRHSWRLQHTALGEHY